MRKVKWKIMVDNWRIGENESWFSDMAKEGWHLRKVGAFFAHFERGEPQDTQYRIDTSSNKKTSVAGWQHVTKLGEFNVFSSPTELQAPELYMDPVEQFYELKDLAGKMKKNNMLAIIMGILSLAMIIVVWFETLTLRFISGVFIPLVLIFMTSNFTALQANISIRALWKKLQRGIAIDHHATWRKKRRLTLAIHGFLIILLIVSISMLLVQTKLNNPQTLPIESVDLPIVRLAEIEQNPNLVREEHFVDDQLDMLNQYSYNWSPIAPLQYESNENGIVPGQLWQDEDVTYSPSLRTEVYRLNFPSLSEKLLADLVRINMYEGDVVEQESDVFDSLFIYEEEGSKKVFVAKGKSVVYVAYFGYADTANILQQIEEKMALIEN